MSLVVPSDGGYESALGPTLNQAVVAELRLIGEPEGDEFLAELIGAFTDDIERLLPELRHALRAGDTTAVGHAAHSMKGSGGHIGGQRFALACARLEGRAAAGSPSLDPGALREVEVLYAELLTALGGELSPAG
jgi:HPt (histidine-containing phosphotransfer) domain-containing protein